MFDLTVTITKDVHTKLQMRQRQIEPMKTLQIEQENFQIS